jgi:hypothetical protein
MAEKDTKTDPSSVYYIPAGSPVAPDPFDVRIRLRSLSKGGMQNESLKKYLDSLPDDASNAVVVKFGDLVNDETSDVAH